MGQRHIWIRLPADEMIGEYMSKKPPRSESRKPVRQTRTATSGPTADDRAAAEAVTRVVSWLRMQGFTFRVVARPASREGRLRILGELRGVPVSVEIAVEDLGNAATARIVAITEDD
jgi:hypothetical protein